MDRRRPTDLIEPIMSWWIGAVPGWMQPRLLWHGYYWLLEKYL
jgi:hypothetical protein